jgi:hypothetical protein
MGLECDSIGRELGLDFKSQYHLQKKKGSEGGAWCIRVGRELSDPKLSSFFFG